MQITATATETTTLEALPALATPRQVAWACNVSERHVVRMCERGEIAATKLGRLWRINRDALMRRLGM